MIRLIAGGLRDRSAGLTVDKFLRNYAPDKVVRESYQPLRNPRSTQRNAHIRLVPATKAAIGGPNSQ
jgi:hypothetical protein